MSGGGREVWQRWRGDESLLSVDGEPAGKIAIGIRPITDNQIKLREPGRELRAERNVARRKQFAPTRFVLRVGDVQDSARDGELGRGRVANEFNLSLRPALAQQFEGRKRDDEIAQRAAPKDENSAHSKERNRSLAPPRVSSGSGRRRRPVRD